MTKIICENFMKKIICENFMKKISYVGNFIPQKKVAVFWDES